MHQRAVFVLTTVCERTKKVKIIVKKIKSLKVINYRYYCPYPSPLDIYPYKLEFHIRI